GNEILSMLEEAPKLPSTPERIVHGDPKLNNIIFDSEDRARALIDLDTVARMALPLELGDAFRSWCNPGGEDKEDAAFDIALFESAIKGYASTMGSSILAEEVTAIVPATLTISLELAARFAADILFESYFGWNKEKYDDAWEHHFVRAISQWNLARSIKEQQDELEEIVLREFQKSGVG
ncbi:aminoglycoside phosphotransferase family protein, partial [Myxococcota bacterium]|nr:aminoglycoside phosphotransferase family protein [Myxococcota bacterium]